MESHQPTALARDLAAAAIRLRRELATAAQMDDSTERLLWRERFEDLLGERYDDDQLDSLADAIREMEAWVVEYLATQAKGDEDAEQIRGRFYAAAAQKWIEEARHV